MTREEAEGLIGKDIGKKISISPNQWQKANQYRKLYGPGMPSIEICVINHRRKIEEKSIQEFVEWLNIKGFLQNLAFGEKIIKIKNGFHIAIESVKRTQSMKHIIHSYYQDFLNERTEECSDNEENLECVPCDGRGNEHAEKCSKDDETLECDRSEDKIEEDESEEESDDQSESETGEICYILSFFFNNVLFFSHTFFLYTYEESKQCPAKCRKSGLRCFLEKNHKGRRHKYTPAGLVSPSTIEKILLEVTSGEIRSLAGLDNISTIKGHENFLNMKAMVDNLTGIIGGDETKEKGDELKKEIDWIVEWHKVDFIPHLGKGESKCMCMKCGFYDDEVDKIICENKNNHMPPCFNCQRTFKVRSSFIFYDSRGDTIQFLFLLSYVSLSTFSSFCNLNFKNNK